MPVKRSKRLVIDASVARSAGGETAVFPTSKHCRDFLRATLETGHCVVMTPVIREEWQRNKSRFARQWLVSMTARKKVYRLDSVMDKDLRHTLGQVATSEKDREAMLKDCLLVEAAIVTDRSIISLDETVRSLFSGVAQELRTLRRIVWINPDKEHEQSIIWLKNGAKLERKRLLGSRRDE